MPATGTNILNEPTDSHGSASFAAGVLILFVRLYQVTLGPLLGGQCRFQPTCSHYAIESLRMHGAVRGSWLTIRRLLRCHPFGGSGFDPVPRSDSPCHSSNEESSR